MVKSIKEKDFLRNEILELETELELAEKQGVNIKILEEIKKELSAKINRYNFITNQI